MGPVNTVRLVRGEFAFLEEVHVDLTVMLGSDMIMFSNTRVPVLRGAWWIGEVPVVRVRAHGNASQHTRIELFRPLVPLFLGVVLKNSLVQFLPGPRQRGFLAVFRRIVRRAPRVQPRLHLFLGVDVRVKQRVDCFLTRRNRNDLIPFTDIHLTFHAVLVRDPLAEPVDVLPTRSNFVWNRCTPYCDTRNPCLLMKS